MTSDEEGSTFLIVLAAVTILTVMMAGLLGVSNRSLNETVQYDNETKALANARSGMLAVYNQMEAQWQTLSQNGFSSITSAENGLTQLAPGINSYAWPSQLFTVSVQAPNDAQHNNFSEISTGATDVSTLYQTYKVSVTGTSGGIQRTLTDTFTISGAIDALNYALYTPGDLLISGAPEISGHVAVGGSMYFDPTPWEGTVLGGYGSSFLKYEGSTLEFYPEQPGEEPNLLPAFDNGSSVASQNGLYSFSSFNDQNKYNSGSYDFGDSSSIADKKAISTFPNSSNPLSNYATGLSGNSLPHMILPANYVQQIITNNQSTDPTSNSVLNQAKALGSPSKSWLNNNPNNVPSSGGYMGSVGNNLAFGNVTTVSGALYINGGLTISSNAVLNMDAPLFVNGNLVINGILNSKATIFVSGTTTITNVPPDVKGQTPSRLELYSLSNIFLTLLNTGNVAAQSPTTFDTFLASNDYIYLEGMDSYFHINGGAAGKSLILDSTVGDIQSLQNSTLMNTTPKSSSGYNNRRLVITYDPSYVIDPLIGTPTVGNLTLQPMPQPVIVN